MALRTFVKCCPLLVTGLDHPSLALEGWSVGIVVLAWTLDPDVLLPTDSRRRGGLVRPTRVTSGAGVLPVSAGRQSGTGIVCLLIFPSLKVWVLDCGSSAVTICTRYVTCMFTACFV